MTEVLRLARKIEQATAGDRDLDIEVIRAAVPELAQMSIEEMELANGAAIAPTQSRDDAMAMIEGTMKDIGCPVYDRQCRVHIDPRGQNCAFEISVPSREFKAFTIGKDAEARAMCVAALRARAFYPETRK